MESAAKLEALKETVIGDNKYLNNLKKHSNFEKPLVQNNLIRKGEEEKSSAESKKFFGQTSSSKKKFAKKLFADFNEDNFIEEENQLPQIPEKSSEYEFLSKGIENENSNPVSRLLDFESEGSRESEDEIKAFSQESEETFHTPTKSPPQMETVNNKFNQFSTMTMKKEPKSKLFTMFSNTTAVPDRSSTEIRPENTGIKKTDKQKLANSRFNQDYDVIQVRSIKHVNQNCRSWEVDVLVQFINAKINLMV